jgi:hypothetical protein
MQLVPFGGLKFRPSLDPGPESVPVVARVGWRPDGLRVSVEVEDAERTVELKKVKSSIEWFWMTDAVELLVRPGAEDVDSLDELSVKIWAVPDGLNRGRPFVGALRRHKRVIGPAAGVKVVQLARKGGYLLEFTVPARVIQKGPLKPWSVLRFNLLVEDCEKVQEVCWSAHQGDWTTERPSTWGKLVLAP